MNKNKNPFYNDKKSSKKYLLKGGSIIDVIKKITQEDLFIKNKVIDKIGKNLSQTVDKETEIINCENLLFHQALLT